MRVPRFARLLSERLARADMDLILDALGVAVLALLVWATLMLGFGLGLLDAGLELVP